MKIAQIQSWLSHRGGGPFEVVCGLSRALAELPDMELAILGLLDSHSEAELRERDLPPVTALPTLGPRELGFSLSLRSSLSRVKPDVVHLHGIWQLYSLTASNWARRQSRPYLISVHGMLNDWALGRSWLKKKAAIVGYVRDNLNHADCLHAASEDELAAIRSVGFRVPICVIPNGVQVPPSGTIQESGWEDGRSQPMTLLYLGRIHPGKGLDELADAWKIFLSEDGPGREVWKLKIMGWGPAEYRRKLQLKIDTLELGETVQLLGPAFNQEKCEALRSSDGFILPSISEGVPISVLEAWSFAKPVLMTRACNLPEGFEVGAAMEIGNGVRGIASGLHALAALGPRARYSMGAEGLKLVESRFAWRELCKRFEEVYRWLQSGGGQPDFVDN